MVRFHPAPLQNAHGSAKSGITSIKINQKFMGEKMEITLTLSEVMEFCYDWETFCRDMGWSVWACSEGGGDVTISLTKEQAIKYGILEGSQWESE